MDHFVQASKMLKKSIKEGNKDFILYPYGKYGNLIHDILRQQFGIEPKYIIDNGLTQYNNNIYSTKDIPNLKTEGCIFLITSDNEGIYSDIRFELMKYVDIKDVVDVFSESMYFDVNRYYEEEVFSHPRLMSLEKACREIYMNNVEGAIAECGVYRGWFAGYMSRLMPDRKIYLFDTFSGFDDRDIDEKEKNDSGEFRERCPLNDASVEMTLKNIAYRKNAIVRKGYFPDTTVGLENEKFALVSLDTDLYKPIYAGLEFFWERLNPGGYIFVDDLGHKDLKGVRKAILDFCKKEKVGYVSIYDGTDATAIFAKPLY